jgi:hypothetical protein
MGPRCLVQPARGIRVADAADKIRRQFGYLSSGMIRTSDRFELGEKRILFNGRRAAALEVHQNKETATLQKRFRGGFMTHRLDHRRRTATVARDRSAVAAP